MIFMIQFFIVGNRFAISQSENFIMMDQNNTGVIVSFSFVVLVIAVAYVLTLTKRFDPEVVRKFIHIGVSNWYFIYVHYFNDVRYAITVPIIFVIVNAVATFSNLTKYLEMRDRRRNYGLIYFPISLVVLAILQYYYDYPLYAVGMSILIMGYGDGLSALVGKKYGKKRIPSISAVKTYVGCSTMFFVTFAVVLGISYVHKLSKFQGIEGYAKIIIISFIATILEAATPFSLDNLTVPIGIIFAIVYI